jgi:hypothetical protein
VRQINVQKYVVHWERSGMNEVAKSKMGRPVIGEPKNVRTEIRFDKSTLNKLDELCKKEKMSRSEYVRMLINKVK